MLTSHATWKSTSASRGSRLDRSTRSIATSNAGGVGLTSRSLADAPAHVAGDYPEWLDPHLAQAFGEDRVAEATAMASRAPLALRYAREAIAQGLDRPLAEGLAVEAHFFGLAAATDDMAEGVRAFLEKRQASFTGR